MDGKSWDGNWRENCSASGEYLGQKTMVTVQSHAYSNCLGGHNDNRMKYGDLAGIRMDRVVGIVPQDVSGTTEPL